MLNTSSPQVQMIVDTQLINDWQNISPFKSNGQLAAIQGPDGSVQAFTTGTDGNIYNIWKDSHSATGWSFLNINYPDAVLNPILAVGQDLDNNIVIMAASPDPQNSRYWYCKNQNWGQGWSQVSTDFDAPGVGYSAIQSIQLFRGNEGLFCMTNGYTPDDPPANNAGFIVCFSNYQTSTETYLPTWPTLTSPSSYFPTPQLSNGLNFLLGAGSDMAPHIPYTSVVNEFSMGVLNGTGEGIFVNQADPSNVNNSIIFFYPMFGSQPEVIPGNPLTILASDSYSLLSTTVNLQGYSELFLIHNPDHSLNYVVQGPNNSYSLFNLSAALNNIQFTSINPSTNTAGELEVFALGNDSNLYHAYLNSSNGQWTPLTPIISGISHLSVSQNSDGYSEVFAISNVNLLYNIHQDTNPDTGLGWQIELIEFPSNGSQPALISTYSSLVSLSDEVTTKPLAQEPLMVYASDLLEVQINGKYTSIDPDNGAGCETDSTGKVTINYTADGLNTPTLKITAGFLDPEEALFIDPGANAKATVDSMTVSDLQTASTPNLPGITSAPLLAPNYQTPSGAAGVQSSFQQLLNFQSSQLQTLGQTTKFINRGKARHGVYYGKADLKTIKRIDPDSVKDQHWHISFSPVFTFEKLDQETVRQRIKDIKLGSIQSLFDSWDDLWTGIENSAISFLDWVCDGVCSTITYIVDGISYYYDQVIETVDQAINALEGLFELFGATIIEWLTYLGNLLSWEDILNTSQNIQPYFLQPLTTVQGLLAKGNISVNSWFAGQRQNVTSFFDNINTYFPATDTVQNAQSYNNETIPGSEAYKSRRTLGYRFAEDNTVTVAECFDPSVAGNWLLDKLWENTNGGSGNDSFSIPSDLLASVNDLFTAIENSQASQDVQDLVAQVQTLLTSLTSNESNWEQTTVAALLNIFQDLILLLLDAADAIATLLLQLAGSLITVLESFFTAAIDIPIVSWFYGYITNGQTLTWIGLCSLLIAVPMTIGYKLANNNNPPFPLQLSKDSAEWGTNPIPEAIIAWISTTSLLAYPRGSSAGWAAPAAAPAAPAW